MKLYIFLFIFFAVMSFVELFIKKNKLILQIIICVTFVLLVILTTIRGGTYGDYETYKLYYFYVKPNNLFSKSNFPFEPLFSILQWLCKCVYDNYQFFVFIIGFIVLFLEFSYAKNFRHRNKSSEKYMFTILFIFWGLYYCNIFVIRSTLAMMICLYSVRYIQSGNVKKFVLFDLIAVGFHYSALVFLPAYFIYNYKCTLKRKLLILFGGIFFLGVYIRNVILMAGKILGGTVERKLSAYLAGGDSFGIGSATEYSVVFLMVKAIINIGGLLAIGIYLWKYHRKDRNYEGYFNLYCVGCILYLSTMNIGYAFARLSIYYNIFQIPMLTYMVSSKCKNRMICWGIIVVYIGVRYFVNLNGSAIVPFVTFWK